MRGSNGKGFVCGGLRVLAFALPLAAGAPALGEEGFLRGLSIEGGTDFPVSIGVRGIARFPVGVRLSAGVGFMPGPYVALIDRTLVAFNAFNQETADLIEASISNSLIVSAAAGWDPGEPGGFFCDLGYMAAMLGGKVSTAALIQEVTGKPLTFVKGDYGIPVSTTLHNLTIGAGWRFIIAESLTVSAALGVFKAVGSSTSADFKLRTPAATAAEGEIDSYMNDIYVKYVVSPFLAVGAGYRFW